MSFIITIYLKEGIVMASDSRTTFNNQETIPATKDGDVPITLMQYGVNSSDTNYKTFVTVNNVGISTCGDASINGEPITGYIESFLREYNSAEVDTVANSILSYFNEIAPKLTSIFIIAGYKYIKENQYTQMVYVVSTKDGTVEMVDTTFQGAQWHGEFDILMRLIQPIAIKNAEGNYVDLPQYSIPFSYFTLQDAIEFAEYATRTTIDTMRFQQRMKTVGGPIDILVLKPNSHQWIARKELHV